LKLTAEDIGLQDVGLGNELFIRLKDKRKYAQLKQQILSDHEKAETYRDYLSYLEPTGQCLIDHLDKENKQLKAWVKVSDKERLQLKEIVEKIKHKILVLQTKFERLTLKWGHAGSDEHLIVLNQIDLFKELLAGTKEDES